MAFQPAKESKMFDDETRSRLIIELSMAYQCDPDELDAWCCSIHNKSFWELPGDADELALVRLSSQQDYIDRLYPAHAGNGADYDSVMIENATQIFNAATDPCGMTKVKSIGYGSASSKAIDLTLTVLAQQLKPLMVLSQLQSAPYTWPDMSPETAINLESPSAGPFDNTSKYPGFWSFCASSLQENLALHAARYAKRLPIFQPKDNALKDGGDASGPVDNKPYYESPEF